MNRCLYWHVLVQVLNTMMCVLVCHCIGACIGLSKCLYWFVLGSDSESAARREETGPAAQWHWTQRHWQPVAGRPPAGGCLAALPVPRSSLGCGRFAAATQGLQLFRRRLIGVAPRAEPDHSAGQLAWPGGLVMDKNNPYTCQCTNFTQNSFLHFASDNNKSLQIRIHAVYKFHPKFFSSLCIC